MKNSEICRAAQFYLATSPKNYRANLSGNSMGICFALYLVQRESRKRLRCYDVLTLLNLKVEEWGNGAYLLAPLDFANHNKAEVKRAYTTRVMLLELAAILYEELGD